MDDDLDWLADLQISVNGKWWFNLDAKGMPKVGDEGVGEFVRFKPDPKVPVTPALVHFGETINLKNFESGRIDVTIEAIGPTALHVDTWDWAELWAEEMLAREVASIKGEKRDEELLPPAPPHVLIVMLSLGYGLTLNTGDFNGKRLAYSYTLPCAPDAMEVAWAKMGEFVGVRIAKKVAEIRGHKNLIPSK